MLLSDDMVSPRDEIYNAWPQVSSTVLMYVAKLAALCVVYSTFEVRTFVRISTHSKIEGMSLVNLVILNGSALFICSWVALVSRNPI
jgi:hypothetical protein